LKSLLGIHVDSITPELSANATEREADRVKRISRPVWRACKIVSEQMRHAMSYAASKNAHAALSKVEDWEMRLRHSMDVSWQDLTQDHPKFGGQGLASACRLIHAACASRIRVFGLCRK
jgi:hypothetical protein